MASGAPPHPRRPILPLAASTLSVLVALGVVTHGPAGGLSIAGLLAVLVAVPAAAVGRARWAHIGSRRVAAAIAVLGVVAFLAGAVAETRTLPASDSSSVVAP